MGLEAAYMTRVQPAASRMIALLVEKEVALERTKAKPPRYTIRPIGRVEVLDIRRLGAT